MDRTNFWTTIAGVVLVGILVQVLLYGAETAPNPERVAIEFSKAYFQRDPALLDMVCSELRSGIAAEQIERHFYRFEQEVRQRGVTRIFLREKLYHISTRRVASTPGKVQIQLEAERRAPFRAFFTIVEDGYEDVAAELTVVREKGRWRVCGNPFGLLTRGSV